MNSYISVLSKKDSGDQSPVSLLPGKLLLTLLTNSACAFWVATSYLLGKGRESLTASSFLQPPVPTNPAHLVAEY